MSENQNKVKKNIFNYDYAELQNILVNFIMKKRSGIQNTINNILYFDSMSVTRNHNTCGKTHITLAADTVPRNDNKTDAHKFRLPVMGVAKLA